MHFRRAKEALTICRRDVRKLISAAVEEGVPGDWGNVNAVYTAVLGRLSRYPDRTQVEETLEEMELLREEILNLLDSQFKTANLKGNAVQNDRHIQNSNSESINEFEPAKEKQQGEILEDKRQLNRDTTGKPQSEVVKSFPLGMVIRACPQIVDYGPGGGISHWRELMAAAVVVRSMLGVSPSAYQEACDTMGAENAAVAMACILERSNFINSAGGYLRDLTRRSENGEFSLGPMLMALLKANGHEARLAG